MAVHYKAYIAEAIATFGLVFIGAGSILAGNNILGVALAHGLVLMSMVYATGHISGGHVNPAVTFGMILAKKIEAAEGFAYIIFQLIGASIAGFLLKFIFSGAGAAQHLGTPALASGVGFWLGTIIELVLTFFLVFTVFSTAVDKRAPAGIYGLAIGLVLTFDILVGGNLTGAAMNPARAFGPALAAGFFNGQLVYWIGPLIGGALAALVHGIISPDRRIV